MKFSAKSTGLTFISKYCELLIIYNYYNITFIFKGNWNWFPPQLCKDPQYLTGLSASLCVRDYMYTLNHIMYYIIIYACLYISQPNKWQSSPVKICRFSYGLEEKNPLKYYNKNSTTQYNWAVLSGFNDFSLFGYDNPQSSIQKYSAKYLFILFTNKMCSSASYSCHSKCYYFMWWTEIMRNIYREKS